MLIHRYCNFFVFILLLAGCQKHIGSAEQDKAAALKKPVAKVSQVWIRYPEPNTPLSKDAALGKQLFFDASLSASGKQSCASCHSPEHAYAPANNLAVQLGGEDMQQSGTRAVPSLRYLNFTPKFTRHYYLPSTEGLEDEGPTGGFTQDGAVDSLSEQAKIPLLAMNEMANKDADGFSRRLQQSPHARHFVELYGKDIFENSALVLDKAAKAIEAFETEDFSFHPYTSKFDAVASGKQQFSDAELRGFQVFHSPSKGNCAKCHIDRTGAGGRPAQFTDFGFEAIGAPRNSAIPANNNPRYFDMGLCGPYRKDLKKETGYCGMFKTPTLRNVATRGVFFHNGVLTTLEDVIRFYAERDSHPEKWYPAVHGKIDQYNDLPKSYRQNVDHINAPFNRSVNDKPALTEEDMQDLIAFLKTLNDGYLQAAQR